MYLELANNLLKYAVNIAKSKQKIDLVLKSIQIILFYIFYTILKQINSEFKHMYM